MRRLFRWCAVVVVTCSLPLDSAALGISDAERLQGLERLDRAYYSFQLDTRLSFEQAVPAATRLHRLQRWNMSEEALKQRWGLIVSDYQVQEEWSRMKARSQMPERLNTLINAFGGESSLLLDVLVRPIVVERIARAYYYSDRELHAAAHARADKVSAELQSMSVQEACSRLDMHVTLVVGRSAASRSTPHVHAASPCEIASVIVVPDPESEALRAKRAAGGIRPVSTVDDSTVIRVRALVEDSASHLIILESWVQKTPLDEWLMSGIYPPATTAQISIADSGVENASLIASSTGKGLPAPDDETACERWRAIGDTGAPSPRYEHTGVWTGTKFLVWGGGPSGGAYDPVTDSWAAMTTSGQPQTGVGHTAIWTGQHMIVWGGDATGEQPGIGARYDPWSDSWTPLSTSGAPLGRWLHGAVWTGTEMLVWGGTGDAPIAGGRYNDAADAWTSMSVDNAPEPRGVTSAVWTGTEMVVWGGERGTTSSQVRNTGGRYNPASDTWSSTSLVGAPAPRTWHATVWTGNRMIVWGGFDWSSQNFADGFAYDPVADTWAPISAGGAPTPRRAVATAWTGSQMIVWGGYDGTVNFSDGARYEPAFDRWSPVIQSGAPSARRHAAAAWTGMELLIWGGYGDRGSLGTGDAYRYTDAAQDCDSDGYSEPADCDNWNPATFPGAPQLCDGINNDCTDPIWPAAPQNELDQDHDGLRACAGDCNDLDSSTYPGAPQLCDARNNNCTDALWPNLPAEESDSDADGVMACSGDCNDGVTTTFPGAPERCNTIDDDCDGRIDDGDDHQLDADGDGVVGACDNCAARANADQRDEDLDSIGNACDNCLLTWNDSQEDWDADDRGDVCDNCRFSFNPTQEDQDADHVGDVCDNCLATRNESQHDLNGDGTGDECDLEDGVVLLGKIGRPRVRWQNDPAYSTYNLYRGSLSVLRATGAYTQEPGSNPYAQRWCGLTITNQDDPLVPSAGDAYYWLVAGSSALGEEPLGDGSGVSRPNDHPCP